MRRKSVRKRGKHRNVAIQERKTEYCGCVYRGALGYQDQRWFPSGFILHLVTQQPSADETTL